MSQDAPTSNSLLPRGYSKHYVLSEKVSGKRGRGRSRLTSENTVSKVLEDGHVKSMRTPRSVCMKRLMTVDEAKEVCRDRSVWRSVLSDYY